MVSLLGPETPHRSFTGINDTNHLKLTFHDIIEPSEGFTAPRSEHVETLVDFLKARQGDDRCSSIAGRGSAARRRRPSRRCACYHPDVDERQLARQLRALSHVATPNRRIVAYADDILNRQGRMVDAVDAIGRGENAYEGVIFQWKI